MYLLTEPATEVGELRGARQTLEHRVRVEVGVLTVTHQSLGERGNRQTQWIWQKVGKRE